MSLITLNLIFLSSEQLFKEMADRIESDGFKEAGYEYVCIDVSKNRQTDRQTD